MKKFLLFLASFMLGVAFLTYPAAANLLTENHALSTHEYGFLYVPFIIATIFTSLLSSRFTLKGLFLLGCVSNAASMLLFFLSNWMPDYVLLLLSTTFLGVGFGALITVFTPYMLKLFPEHTSVAIVAIYGFECLGASMSPLLFHFIHKYSLWWVDPLATSSAFVLIFLVGCFALTENEKRDATKRVMAHSIWLFVALMFLYGTASTIFSNWGAIFIHQELGFPREIASYALSLLWGFTLLARLVIVSCQNLVDVKWAYLLTPLLAVCCFFITPWMETESRILVLFALGGIAFSVTFPLTFSYAMKKFKGVSGLMTTSYIVGYGVASYGTGFFYDILHISLTNIYFYSFVLALGIFSLSLYNIVHK